MKKRVLLILLMSIILVLRAFFASVPLTLLFFAFFLGLVIFDKYRYKVIYICYFLPWTMFIKLNPTSTSLFSVVDLVFVLLFLVKYKKDKKIFDRKVISALIIFALYICCTTFLSIDFNIVPLVSLIIHMLTIYIFVYNTKTNQDKVDICYSLLCGTITSGLVFMFATINDSLMNYLLTYTEIETVLVSGKLFYRCSGLDYDPNYFSVLCLIFSWASLLVPKKKNFFYVVLPVIGLCFGILSLSKMYFISLIVSILLYILLLSKGNMKIKYIFIIIVIGSVLFYFFGNTIISIFEQRLKNVSNVNDLTTGRSEIWDTYIDYLLLNPIRIIFGGGMNANSLYGRAAHNSFITGIFKFGLIGLTLLINYYRSLFIKLKNSKIKYLYYLPLLLLLLTFLSLDTVTYDFLPYLLLTCIIVLANGRSEINEKNI